MTISKTAGGLPGYYFSSLIYNKVKLPDMELELESEGEGLLALIPDLPSFILTPGAVDDLCKLLEVPSKFANKLQDSGKAYIIAYLQKQLSKAIETPITYVSSRNDEGKDIILSFATDKNLPIYGEEGIALDDQIVALVSQPDYPLELISREVADGVVQYLFFTKEATAIAADKEAQGMYRWGFSFEYSLLGRSRARFGARLLRVACGGMTHLPDKIFGKTLEWDTDSFKDRCAGVIAYLTDEVAKQDWKQIGRWVTRLINNQASVFELKSVRRKLLAGLKLAKDDIETEERIDKLLKWTMVVKQYGLDDKEFKPSKTWLSNANTPVTLFDLFKVNIKEAAAAPRTYAYDVRNGLFVYSGKVLTKLPDLAEKPPVVDWD